MWLSCKKLVKDELQNSLNIYNEYIGLRKKPEDIETKINFI